MNRIRLFLASFYVMTFLLTATYPAAASNVNSAYPLIGATLTVPANVIQGSRFDINVQVTNRGSGSAYCMTVRINLPSGFTIIGSQSQTTQINGNQSQTLKYSASAPNRSGISGTITANIYWSNFSSCSGTLSQTYASAQVIVVSNGPSQINGIWQLTVRAIPAGIASHEQVRIDITNSYGGLVDTKSVDSPYVATFTLKNSPGWYTITIYYRILVFPWDEDTLWPVSKAKQFYISGTQSVTVP